MQNYNGVRQSDCKTLGENNFKGAMKSLFTNSNVILLMTIFGLIQGVFNTLGTVIDEIAADYDFKPVKFQSLTLLVRSLNIWSCIDRGWTHWICNIWSLGRNQEDIQALCNSNINIVCNKHDWDLILLFFGKYWACSNMLFHHRGIDDTYNGSWFRTWS